MAGDWIKMRAALTTDPKVAAIVGRLEADTAFLRWLGYDLTPEVVVRDGALRYMVTGALHNAWCNANEHASLGASRDIVAGAGLDWIDQVTGVPGLGLAMASVGWAEECSEGLRFPNFNRHNTSGAERQRRYRLNKRDNIAVTRDVTRYVTGDVTLRPREEKSREEKSSKSPCSPPASKDGAIQENYGLYFEELWRVVAPHKRKSKAEAAKRYKEAIAIISKRPGMKDPHGWLKAKAAAYYLSPLGQTNFCNGPAPWLHQGCYDDDPAAWQRDRDNQPHEPVDIPYKEY